MSEPIGKYAVGKKLTRAHVVESVINERPVTRCGRTLVSPVEYADTTLVPVCRGGCDRGA